MKTFKLFMVPFLALFLFAGCSNGSTETFQKDPSKKFLVEEFSDIECPYCKTFHPVIDKLQKDFPDGQFRYAYYPLESLHKYAFRAAEATECVRKNESEETFHNYLTKLYGSSTLEEATLKSLAEKEGVNMKTFSSCLQNGDAVARVKADMKEGAQRGVTGTPTVFINGTLYKGDRSYEDLYKTLKSVE